MDKFTIDPMLDDANRARLMIKHPLLTTVELLMTPPIHELYVQIKSAVLLRGPGYYIIGPSGIGKSAALCLVEKMLKMEYPDLAVYIHDPKNQQVPSIRAFFSNFLTTVKHKELKGETHDLRLRVTRRLVDDARTSGLSMVVMLIDEAQAMSVQDFLFLKDLDNSLNREGVKFVTVMMAQSPDFEKVLMRLHDERRLDLKARFAMNEIPFRAYSTLEDIGAIFSGIDNAVFPEHSAIRWTQFFFPKAYASGFRLKNEAPKFLAALSKVSAAKTNNHAFPARQLFHAIRIFVGDNAFYDSFEFRLPPDAWEKAAFKSKVHEAMVMMDAVGGKTKIKVRT